MLQFFKTKLHKRSQIGKKLWNQRNLYKNYLKKNNAGTQPNFWHFWF